jgi:hypothetical protein
VWVVALVVFGTIVLAVAALLGRRATPRRRSGAG